MQELLRKQIIEMVLATDMKQHFAIHSMFQAKLGLSGARPSGGGNSGGMPRISPQTPDAPHKSHDGDQISLCLQVRGASMRMGLSCEDAMWFGRW